MNLSTKIKSTVRTIFILETVPAKKVKHTNPNGNVINVMVPKSKLQTKYEKRINKECRSLGTLKNITLIRRVMIMAQLIKTPW